ncbi:hypothetical protein A0H81_13287 [Grifola frondosa]|uniref:Uncharacterized protein n=1 Tax=Grifola frondosa TaxID=5627 RepID=A0A1C7LPH2_GRIFR|nr:hypothetical protein A0H81_13287 [Grifola frondosa]
MPSAEYTERSLIPSVIRFNVLTRDGIHRVLALIHPFQLLEFLLDRSQPSSLPDFYLYPKQDAIEMGERVDEYHGRIINEFRVNPNYCFCGVYHPSLPIHRVLAAIEADKDVSRLSKIRSVADRACHRNFSTNG